jgi:hypothetical protein
MLLFVQLIIKRKNDGGEGGRKYPGTHDDDEQKEESS